MVSMLSEEDDNLTRTIDGHWFAGDIDNDDIVKRIR